MRKLQSFKTFWKKNKIKYKQGIKLHFIHFVFIALAAELIFQKAPYIECLKLQKIRYSTLRVMLGSTHMFCDDVHLLC